MLWNHTLPGARQRCFCRKFKITHRLFIVYGDGPVQEIGNLGMDPAAGHIAILSHGDVGVSEVVGADPRRETLIVDQRCHRLTE
jgi:hypothetical protein